MYANRVKISKKNILTLRYTSCRMYLDSPQRKGMIMENMLGTLDDTTDMIASIKTVLPTMESIWESHKMVCFTAGNPFNGLNGYVIIPEEAPLDDNDDFLYDFNVHGGVTFNRTVEGIGRIIGWDTCHLGDQMDQSFIPVDLRDNLAFTHLFNGRTWSKEDVMQETDNLALQVSQLIAEKNVD